MVSITPHVYADLQVSFDRKQPQYQFSKTRYEGGDMTNAAQWYPDSTKKPDLLGFPLFNVTDFASLGSGANNRSIQRPIIL
jgi:hypothetical protein